MLPFDPSLGQQTNKKNVSNLRTSITDEVFGTIWGENHIAVPMDAHLALGTPEEIHVSFPVQLIANVASTGNSRVIRVGRT